MPFAFRVVKYPSKRQVELWSLRRNQHKRTGQIAKRKKISLAAVSKTLREADERIRILLENAAKMNKIRIDKLSSQLGYARGFSLVFKVTVYITYSPANGVQVWYEHEGPCEGCEKLGECRIAILQEYEERQILVLNSSMRPTDLGELLFKKIEEGMEVDSANPE